MLLRINTESIFREAFRRAWVARHLPGLRRLERGHVRNSLSITLPLSQAVHACIYAKTGTVVRFEVRFLKRVRDNVARNLRDRVEVIDVIEYARQDAARRLSRIMQVLRSMTGSSPFDREVLCARSTWRPTAMRSRPGGFYLR